MIKVAEDGEILESGPLLQQLLVFGIEILDVLFELLFLILELNFGIGVSDRSKNLFNFSFWYRNPSVPLVMIFSKF